MKRFLPFVLAGLLVAILLLGPASTAQADVKPPTSGLQETTDVLPAGAIINQTVRNSPRGIGQIYLLAETFEGSFPEDNGWTVYDCDGTTNGEYFWDDTYYKYWDGSWSAWAANGGANGFDPNDSSVYPNNMCTWMIAGPFDLSGVASGSFHIQYWLQSEPTLDVLKYMVSPNGTNYYGYTPSGDYQYWQLGNIDLSNVPSGLGNVLGDSSVWVGIKFSSDSSIQYKGPYVDAVTVEVVKNCYPLNLLVEYGQGTALTASPTSSGSCSAGSYYAGEVITLTAHPDAGWNVAQWTFTDDDSLKTLTNTLTMPAWEADISVGYSTASTFRSDGVRDGWILESGENTNAGGTLDRTSTTFNLGDGLSDKQYRAILSFDTSSLPDDAVITRVILKIRKQGVVGTNPFDILGGLKVDIRKPFFGNTGGLAVSDFQAVADIANVATFRTTPVNNWYTAVIAAATVGWPFINLGGTTQFRLRFLTGDNNNNIADYMKFFSGNYSTASARPTLVITYYTP